MRKGFNQIPYSKINSKLITNERHKLKNIGTNLKSPYRKCSLQ